jgi:hypothetical protein
MKCPWNNKTGFMIGQVCPILWHTLYPYFLGFVFGAKYNYNKEGDIHVGCPAEHGIDTLVKMRPNDSTFRFQVPTEWRDVIYAEVVKVNGVCDCDYRVGSRIVFPTCKKEVYKCPAGTYNVFPFLKFDVPKCINFKRLRCPDWAETVYYEVAR